MVLWHSLTYFTSSYWYIQIQFEYIYIYIYIYHFKNLLLECLEKKSKNCSWANKYACISCTNNTHGIFLWIKILWRRGHLYQWAIAQLALSPPIIMELRVRSWFQNSIGSYLPIKTKGFLLHIFFLSPFVNFVPVVTND